MAKHPRMVEAIEMAKKAAVSTRGIYPVTKAESVYKLDGSTLEVPTDTATGGETAPDGETPEG